MQSGKPLRHALRRAFAATALACLAVPASAGAAAAPPGAGDLSPRLAELAKPSLRSAPPREQAQALSLAAEGPGSLVRKGNRILVEVRFDHGAAAAVDDLRQAGAKVLDVSPRYQTVTVAAKPDQLRALNGVPRVAGAHEVLKPIAYSTCPSGAAVSEGVQQLHAGEGEYETEGVKKEEARKAFGVDGAGVTVGVLSDSYNRATEAADGSGPLATTASQDVSNGDLPGTGNTCPGQGTPVGVLDDTETEGEDEGRAMAQIVHDVAPGAKLAFATAFSGETAFAENIERLAKPTGEGGAGAKVIVDDVSYFVEPFFQEGPVGVAVRKVTEQGVSYFSAAGNNNLTRNGHDIASWEAPQFRDAGSCPAALASFETKVGVFLNPTHCMDFEPGGGTDTTFGITVSKGATLTVDLQWAEAWEGVDTDLDAFLIGPKGEVVDSSAGDNPAEGLPFELIDWENDTGSAAGVQLVINRYSGADPRLKIALLQNGGGVSATEYETSSGGDLVGPTIFGHNGAEDTISTGAIRYSSSETPEAFSSRGPVTHYFGPVNGATPAAPLGSPTVLAKPDLTATDCGATTFFAFESAGTWRFCGTSAAAPHAAGVAALMLQRDPSATPADVRSALTESAAAIGAFGPDAVGAGLVDAVGALGRLPEAEEEAGESEEESSEEEEEEEEEESEGEEPEEEGGEREEESGGGGGGESGVTGTAPSTGSPPQSSSVGEPPKSAPAPETFFHKRPPKATRTRRRAVRLAFGFGSDQPGVAFLCKVDRGRFHRCPARFVRRFRVGGHVLRVKARNSGGVVDTTPAVYRFRVIRVRHGRLERRHTHHQRR